MELPVFTLLTSGYPTPSKAFTHPIYTLPYLAAC